MALPAVVGAYERVTGVECGAASPQGGPALAGPLGGQGLADDLLTDLEHGVAAQDGAGLVRPGARGDLTCLGGGQGLDLLGRRGAGQARLGAGAGQVLQDGGLVHRRDTYQRHHPGGAQGGEST